MKYSIEIPQIHCSGCVGLITEILEEISSFQEVKVDLETKHGYFSSTEELASVKTLLDKKFAEIANLGYSYRELTKQF